VPDSGLTLSSMAISALLFRDTAIPKKEVVEGDPLLA
jgi:hypothetical protein